MASQIDTSAKNIALDAIGTSFGYLALFTDVDGTTEVSGGSPAYARKAITWNSASGGVKTISNNPVFDVPAGVTVRSQAIFTAVSGGTRGSVDEVTAEVGAGQWNYTSLGFTLTLT